MVVLSVMAARRVMRYRRPRRIVRRRRFVKRRPFQRRRLVRDTFQATSDINRGGWNFKRRRFNPTKWKRDMWKSSNAAQKYRSQNALPFTVSTPTAYQQCNVIFVARIPDAGGGSRFWQVAGGLVTNNDTPATTDFGGGDFFLRGGLSRLQITNPSTVDNPVRVSTWLCRTTVNGGIPVNPFTVSHGWDPSLPDPALLATNPDRDVYKFYKFWGCQDVLLKPGETFERVTPIKAQKVDQDQWIGLRNRDFWIILVQSTSGVTSDQLQISAAWNTSFTGDRVV